MTKSDFIIVGQKGCMGLETASGKVLLPQIYDKILDYDEDGYVRFLKDGFYATIDLQGKVCIPLSAGLTHLGVFHQGTARAKCNDTWGLVDVQGKHVTEFAYRSIAAHRTGGYEAVTLDGVKGHLLEDGTFQTSKKTIVKKKTEVKRPYLDRHRFKLALSSWLGDQQPLEFFYRDTDAEIEVDSLYKVGCFVCTNTDLIVTQKLLRPVHKVRFLIAARTFQEYREESVQGFRIPAYCSFLVVDVQKMGGITQVVLIHIPHGAMRLARKHHIHLSDFLPVDANGLDLKEAARTDLTRKLSADVHGHSLNRTWNELMFRPVGLDGHLRLLKLVTKDLSQIGHDDAVSKALAMIGDSDTDWVEDKFLSTY